MDEIRPPKIENAPGLKWKRRKVGWEARWEPRTDLRERGFPIKSHGLCMWSSSKELKPAEIGIIQQTCQGLQTEMLVWGRGGVPEMLRFDGTVQGLIDCYMSDPDSTFKKNRYQTRKYYITLCRTLTRTEWQNDEGATLTVGKTPIGEFKARGILRLHRTWMTPAVEGDPPTVAKAHSLIGMMRTLCGFGDTFLEDKDCKRLSEILSGMRFEMAKPRGEALNVDQAHLVIAEANRLAWHSMALAQAIQFECTLRQKDVIGEWIPIEDPGISDTVNGSKKWLRGLRWDEIDENFKFEHVTSKKGKELPVDLKLAPMVMVQLALMASVQVEFLRRDMFPASGPVIVRESTGRPWDDNEFRKKWRKIARACGIEDKVRNMDSRAGAITEAFAGGALPEDVRKGATHSQIQTTNRYSREVESAVKRVMISRVASRNKDGTNEG